ncbi:hypothetical protein O181_067081 [Austropuccinia psidii MF-1]|uniref:Gag-Pol-p199 n=1 Tax=Austropuccinia psidii MF-1 TaxID=1389203 RepID=A0A9Q3I2R1_9BASI|nr:hypothetical protein [Austropuccinia psidii MF-1]
MPEPKNVADDNINVIMEADKQAEIFQRFISLAEKIRPQLQADGANFNLYVNSNIYGAVTSCIFTSDARQIFQALKDQFNRPSWSSVVYHANIIFCNSSDQSENINDYAMTITEAVQNLENQLGQIDSEMLTTLAIYFAVPSMHQLITPAMNTLMATNPNIKVCPDDLLNMIRKISMALPSFDHSTKIARLNAASKFGKIDSLTIGNQQSSKRPTTKNAMIPSSSCQIEPRVPNSQFPRHYCSEMGHWSPNCPIKTKATEMKARAQQQPANVASMGVVPLLEDHEALLDSGATHSVVGKLLLFTSLTTTDMTSLNNPLSSTVSILTSTNSSLNSDSLLWHRRVAHLLLRHLKRMQKSNAISGIPNVSFHDIKLCHNCSIAKSQHCPVKTASRQCIKGPGDLIVADLMGPYEVSLSHKKYILMIQDAFLRVVVAIPLSDKSESKTSLINWMKQFTNVTPYKIKTIRMYNGTKFKNSVLHEFLTQHGIIHEYSMLYEHHQNGRIKQRNRTISEMAHTSLIAAKLPSFLWPWAFRHSVWIFNRFLHADSDKTPFEVLGKRCPSLELLRVFSAKSYLYNHKFKKDFSPGATVGYHLGVLEDSKVWLFWVPTRKDIVKPASVSFDELNFYDARMVGSNVSSLQVNDIFDNSMVNKLNLQDESILDISNHRGLQLSIPSTYREAMISGNKADWLSAIAQEIGSMATEKVLMPCDLHDALKEVPHKSILGMNVNYNETFAPTPTFNSLHLLFSTACLKNWNVRTFELKVAFLHSLIDKPIYIWPPIGMDVPKHKVLKLNKALYGTKQASRCWWLHLKGILQQIGFMNNKEAPSTYTLNRGDQAILWVHVDDGMLTALSDALMNTLIKQLNSYLKIV